MPQNLSYKEMATNSNISMPRMVKLQQAAAETGLTYSCLRRWILTGQFTYFVKAGSKYLVNMDRLAEFLNSPATETNMIG